jgi:hypothetical protein
LIKRSWYYGNYLNDCAKYYDRKELVDKEKPKPRNVIMKEAPIAPKATEASVPKPEEKK